MFFKSKPAIKKEGTMLVLEKPKPIPVQSAKSVEELNEYRELSMSIGYEPIDVTVEDFKRFLLEHDIPIYNRDEVIKYMDNKIAEERRSNKQILGWGWRPLREQDKIKTSFGMHWKKYAGGEFSSDYYDTHQRLYYRTVPLKVLKKAALINKEFGTKVALLISDYTDIDPDPFLMAVICDADGAHNRFIIDFWDEPGFGLEQQLK